MGAPNIKSRKVYAVIESTVEMPCEHLDDFLKENDFTGTKTVAFHKGGVRTVVTQEHIPLTLDSLDKLRTP
jgi:hypothetical protein